MNRYLASTPVGYIELIKRSLRLYRAGFKKVLLLSFILALVIFLPRLLEDFAPVNALLNVRFGTLGIWPALLNLICLIFFIGILWHMNCVARGKREPLIQDMSVGIHKFFYVFTAAIMQTLIIMTVVMLVFLIHFYFERYPLYTLAGEDLTHYYLQLLLTTFYLMGEAFIVLYVSILFIFLTPIIAIENKGIIGALEKSVYLGWNHWWRVFSVQLTPWVVYLFFLFVIRNILLIDVHIFLIDSPSYSIISAILNIILFTIFIPWIPAILLVQLNDLELRKKTEVKRQPAFNL